MKYQGKLYGKVGRKYIPLALTSDDVDKLEAKSTAYDKLVDDDFVTKIKELIESMPEDTEWWCPNCGVTECSCDGRCTQCGCLLDESQPKSLKDFFKSLFERFILPNGDNHV
ncbi:MAG: hypothetical protein WC248_04555 [Candidatus Methanomethylophilaceae archaeon]|jgi:uncharacterized paraquat-inducible protein A